MHAIAPDAVVIGVDTHKDVHVAVAINGLGARLATASFPVTSVGEGAPVSPELVPALDPGRPVRRQVHEGGQRSTAAG